jgi:3-dehydroquinate synthase
VSQAPIADRYAEPVRRDLEAGGVRTEVFLIPDGEQAKVLGTVEDLCRRFASWGLLRGDVVVALGGGVVGDTAGFASAVYHRGVALVQVPTTLVAQVDAAIGGKTAVDLPEGKNLVGAFHQPIGVIVDPSVLATLPVREFAAGLGEVAKYASMPGGEAVERIVSERTAAAVGRDPEVLEALIAECVRMKARVVVADPEERTGLRATLNYGHTLAHALETAGGYELRHGEAVEIGLVFAGALAAALGRADAATVARRRVLVERLGLPATVPGQATAGRSVVPTAGELLALMRRDKKSVGGLSFVLPGGDGLETVHDPPADALASAFRAVGVHGDVEG